MITHNWSTPLYTSGTDKDLCFNLAQELLSVYDFNNPQNVFEIESDLVDKFKSDVVVPAFNSFLRNTVNKDISDWDSHRLHGWVVSYGKDTSLDYHNHRGSQVSGVFYLMCEDDSAGGHITLTDPRQNANRGYDPSFLPWFEPIKLIPKTGDIVLFPSFLYHSVSTYRSNIRIALPVDLFLHANS